MIDFWNNRYAEEEYAYGIQPNTFFEDEIKKIPIGKLLLPAEGEGRNAVFAAKLGWAVHALDMSEKGKEKTLKLARENKVNIQYDVCALQEFQYAENEYNVLALIYAHFPPQLRSIIHQKLAKSLKTGGFLILEAFSKKQVENKSGGPPVQEMLYSIDEMKSDYKGFEFIEAIETQIELAEGKFHKGIADVIRIKAQKL